MSLVMRKTSKWWYGRYKVDGKEYVKNLQVEIRGTRPLTLKETGSVHFENSRGEAHSVLNALLEEVQSAKSAEALAEAVYEARSGEKLKRYRIQDLSLIWKEKPRKRPPSPEHAEKSISKLECLANHLQKNFPKIIRVDQIRPAHIQSFLNELEQSGMTAATWNSYLVPIKLVLKRAGVPAAKEILAKDSEPVFRKPFSIEELDAVLEAAKSDRLIYSLAVTAACTAMRKKDCCYLSWSDVDFSDGFITVKTSKTGQVVDIPMADMLRAEIEKHSNNGSDFVFPEAKQLYEADASAITKRFKSVLRLAGFDDGVTAPPLEYKTDPYSPEEILKAAEEIYTGGKLIRAKAVLSSYLSGDCIRRSAETAGVSIGSVSNYLNELEAQTKKRLIRGKHRPATDIVPPTRGKMREERKNGLNAASVRDFHSFRTTFVTIALMRGMPLDTVRKITGHQTAEVVTKHYFRPEREQLREAMQNTLPGMLTSAAKPFTPAEKASEILAMINANMSKADICNRVAEALAVLNGSTN
ncbi:tyrosine-type recombinase/integrase [Pontiellaceae bacterium B12227]|nr:tyrosine-type recombinase/integrase [Pontiellaceae bacterium B12227]